MNDSEFLTFKEELFTAFPGLRDHINKVSNEPTATLATWQRTLEPITYAEAKQVLDDWIDGRDEPPKAFERDYAAILIRQKVYHRRSKYRAYVAKHEASNSRAEQVRLAKETRAALAGLGVDAAFELCLRANGKLDRGEIDRSQWLVELDQICSKIG